MVPPAQPPPLSLTESIPDSNDHSPSADHKQNPNSTTAATAHVETTKTNSPTNESTDSKQNIPKSTTTTLKSARTSSKPRKVTVPAPSLLDFMTENEIKRLTKSNTRNNVGDARKAPPVATQSHFTKVCRRLDYLPYDEKTYIILPPKENSTAISPHQPNKTSSSSPSLLSSSTTTTTTTTILSAISPRRSFKQCYPYSSSATTTTTTTNARGESDSSSSSSQWRLSLTTPLHKPSSRYMYVPSTPRHTFSPTRFLNSSLAKNAAIAATAAAHAATVAQAAADADSSPVTPLIDEPCKFEQSKELDPPSFRHTTRKKKKKTNDSTDAGNFKKDDPEHKGDVHDHTEEDGDEHNDKNDANDHGDDNHDDDNHDDGDRCSEPETPQSLESPAYVSPSSGDTATNWISYRSSFSKAARSVRLGKMTTYFRQEKDIKDVYSKNDNNNSGVRRRLFRNTPHVSTSPSTRRSEKLQEQTSSSSSHSTIIARQTPKRRASSFLATRKKDYPVTPSSSTGFV